MAAALTLHADPPASWMPQGFVFRGVLDRVAAELEPEDPLLSAALRTAMEPEAGDLSGLAPEAFRRLLAAARHAFDLAASAGAAAFHRPESYPGYMYQFSELLALLREDSRAPDNERSPAAACTPAGRWEGPAWVLALALEHLAVSVQAADPALARQLLDLRAIAPAGEPDLRALSAGSLASLRPGLAWLRGRYGDGQGRSGYAPGFYPVLARHLLELCDLLEKG